ncbi:hypothetical protein [Hymenobacter properus]|uniref:Uncharacterized protein n=1 Tax=Hymenobacter properus TaxID=2791026 RepID=A0A931BPL9_9BACT|nr:hypothetical protein [Hymenobacter properus]MBF9143290.1 hypothetical protein [Hymenobacter properus]MBR7722100.1 hypothetical protein [Microvirga sp. SRT04]
MKASTVAVVACCCLSVGYGIYLKSYDTFSRLIEAEKGMSRQQVIAAMQQPDSTYWEKSKNDSLLVMMYEIENSDGKRLLLKLRHDTVRSVKFNRKPI